MYSCPSDAPIVGDNSAVNTDYPKIINAQTCFKPKNKDAKPHQTPSLTIQPTNTKSLLGNHVKSMGKLILALKNFNI